MRTTGKRIRLGQAVVEAGQALQKGVPGAGAVLSAPAAAAQVGQQAKADLGRLDRQGRIYRIACAICIHNKFAEGSDPRRCHRLSFGRFKLQKIVT